MKYACIGGVQYICSKEKKAECLCVGVGGCVDVFSILFLHVSLKLRFVLSLALLLVLFFSSPEPKAHKVSL